MKVFATLATILGVTYATPEARIGSTDMMRINMGRQQQQLMQPAQQQISPMRRTMYRDDQAMGPTQYFLLNKFGNYAYAYANQNSEKMEEGNQNSVKGRYAYIMSNGQKRRVEYIADNQGFHIIRDDADNAGRFKRSVEPDLIQTKMTSYMDSSSLRDDSRDMGRMLYRNNQMGRNMYMNNDMSSQMVNPNLMSRNMYNNMMGQDMSNNMMNSNIMGQGMSNNLMGPDMLSNMMNSNMMGQDMSNNMMYSNMMGQDMPSNMINMNSHNMMSNNMINTNDMMNNQMVGQDMMQSNMNMMNQGMNKMNSYANNRLMGQNRNIMSQRMEIEQIPSTRLF